jgi:DNA-directed RNA polymerase specialized sigma24 family protein
VGLARRRLNGRASRRITDENDVAQSAFASFFRRAEHGRFPQLNNSADLWRLLIVITGRKIGSRVRRQNCLKRRHPDCNGVDEWEAVDLDVIVGNEPTPEFWAIAMESFQELLSRLDGPVLCSVAIMKMEGYTNEEIAKRLNSSLSTVERKLRRIRHEWASESQERK